MNIIKKISAYLQCNVLLKYRDIKFLSIPFQGIKKIAKIGADHKRKFWRLSFLHRKKV